MCSAPARPTARSLRTSCSGPARIASAHGSSCNDRRWCAINGNARIISNGPFSRRPALWPRCCKTQKRRSRRWPSKPAMMKSSEHSSTRPNWPASLKTASTSKTTTRSFYPLAILSINSDSTPPIPAKCSAWTRQMTVPLNSPGTPSCKTKSFSCRTCRELASARISRFKRLSKTPAGHGSMCTANLKWS